MKILLCNDDGYQAAGIVALYEALHTVADVEVIAPEFNNSAKSNALTLNAPLYVEQAANGFRYIDGTPADCVHIALSGLLPEPPDLVVSGINNGANMGDDTIYSGTVGAAMEGFLFGIPALAFSQVQKGWQHIDAAAQAAKDIVQQLRPLLPERAGTLPPWLLNINIPNLPYNQIKTPALCRLGRRHAAKNVIPQENPHGRTMYWIGLAGSAKDAGSETDFYATAHGHVAVTPLHIDLTHHASFEMWAQHFGTASNTTMRNSQEN